MRLILGLCIATVAWSGCSKVSNSEIEMNRKLWESQKISDYRYTFDASCFCWFGYDMPAIIEVRNSKPFAVLDPTTLQPVVYQSDTSIVLDSIGINSAYVEAWTIDYFFDVIERNRKSYKADVEFNDEFGYPTFIDVDQIKNAIDDEFLYRLSNFKEL